MKPWWITWVIPSIQLVLLYVQLHYHRKSLKVSKRMLAEVPKFFIENSRLWKINRLMVKWIKINHPESYENFKAVCLTEDDVKLLQLKESEGVSDEGNNQD